MFIEFEGSQNFADGLFYASESCCSDGDERVYITLTDNSSDETVELWPTKQEALQVIAALHLAVYGD